MIRDFFTPKLVVGYVVIVAGFMAILEIPKPAHPIEPIPPPKFEDAWRDTSVPLALAPAPVRIIPLDAPKPVKTETITPEVTHSLPTATPVPVIPKQSTDLPTGADICRGKGKRYTHNGRSWRCRR